MAFVVVSNQPGVVRSTPIPTSTPVPLLAQAMDRKSEVFQTDPLFHPPAPPPEAEIIDIRSSDTCPLNNLENNIIDGLSQSQGCKYLPSLLLWGEQGQKLYDEILAAEEYYPYRAENGLLQQRIEELTTEIASSQADLLVELGAGNMSKTALLLSSIDKRLHGPLTYYALDVDRAQLERSLTQLKERTNLRWIKLCGLLGTYDDGAKWLACPDTSTFRTTLIWLGTSIANYEQQAASELLEAFVRDPKTGRPQNLSGILVLVDGCQNATQIKLAYDTPSSESRRWMMNALDSARNHLRGSNDNSEVDKLLAEENWRFEGHWHPERQRFENYFVSTRQLKGTIRGQPIRIEEGERVAILGSGKWSKMTMSIIAATAGLQVSNAWFEDEFNYGAYWLRLAAKQRHDSGVDVVELATVSSIERAAEGN